MKDSNYPSQSGNYIVKVKNGAAWRDYRTARLQISVGGERHEGEKFSATVEWVKHRFDKAIVCVNDMQRFNYMANGMSEIEAFDCSLTAGREWLARHSHEIATLPRFELYRWEEWKGPEFSRTHQDVLKLYNDSEEFRAAIEDGVKNRLSRDYLLEEVAIFSLMYRKEKAVDIYPGTLPKAMDIFHDQHTTRIDFVKRKLAA
jgi:hypothetical protein